MRLLLSSCRPIPGCLAEGDDNGTVGGGISCGSVVSVVRTGSGGLVVKVVIVVLALSGEPWPDEPNSGAFVVKVVIVVLALSGEPWPDKPNSGAFVVKVVIVVLALSGEPSS